MAGGDPASDVSSGFLSQTPVQPRVWGLLCQSSGDDPADAGCTEKDRAFHDRREYADAFEVRDRPDRAWHARHVLPCYGM